MPTTEPTLGCDCGWTSNAGACSESDESYCWNACCLYPAPEESWPAYYDQLEPGRNSQEACDEALGVGLGIGLAGGLVFALVILLGYRKAPGGSDEVIHVFRATELSATDEVFEREAEEADIVPRWVPLAEAVDAALAGRVHNGIFLAAILAEHARRTRE